MKLKRVFFFNKGDFMFFLVASGQPGNERLFFLETVTARLQKNHVGNFCHKCRTLIVIIIEHDR